MDKTVLIIGAGPAGLSAGLHLVKKGINVKILDCRKKVGGLCASLEYNGCIFDYGGHRFYTEDIDILQRLEQITEGELKQRSRKSSIYMGGKFIDYPLRITDLLLKMNTRVLFSALVDYAYRSIKNIFTPSKEDNLEDWISNRFGKVFYNIFFKPYTEKFWGVEVNKIKPEWAEKRITLTGLWDVILRLFKKRKSTPISYITKFYYPDKGMGVIFDKFADEITSLCGEIILDARVTQIKTESGNIDEVVCRKDNKEVSFKPDYVISTMPLTEFVGMLSNVLPQDLVTDTCSLKFRSMIFVFIIINKMNIGSDNWVYFPEADYIFSRITEPKNWSSFLTPESKTSLCVEISCDYNDMTWKAEDEELFTIVCRDLEKTGLVLKGDIESYRIEKWRYCYPMYIGRYKGIVIKTREQLEKNLKNLKLCGRQGQFEYSTASEVIKNGFSSAETVIEYLSE